MQNQIPLLLLAIALVTGCHNSRKTVSTASADKTVAGTQDSSSTKLNGTWELNYISGPRIAFSGLYPEKKPTLVFALPGSEASGNTSCNPYSCNITIAGDKISFGECRSTMMACEGGGEQVFVKTLKQINRYAISNDTTLSFMMGDIAMMRFVKK